MKNDAEPSKTAGIPISGGMGGGMGGMGGGMGGEQAPPPPETFDGPLVERLKHKVWRARCLPLCTCLLGGLLVLRCLEARIVKFYTYECAAHAPPPSLPCLCYIGGYSYGPWS